jgi:outer membrane protein OmpA-like peptidoglycan-associated protein
MRRFVPITLATLALAACGGGQPASTTAADARAGATSGDDGADAADLASASGDADGAEEAGENQFQLRKSEGEAKEAHKNHPSKIKATATEAAMKFVVVDKEKGPIPGIVVSLTAPDGKKYYTEETDAEGYAEVLVPVGQKYEISYLSLGRRDITANVTVADEPNQNIRLTLRYKRIDPAPPAAGAPPSPEPRFVLNGVTFDTGKATIRPESYPRLDSVVEYMMYKRSARIEISGHTDNVGNPKANKQLSEKRAQACRDYLIQKGIDPSRITAVGYGDERPIASNDTEEGRALNRRIEATEL